MKKSLNILFFLFFASVIQAQTVMNLDSLLKLLPKTLQDTNTVTLYINIGQQYETNQPEKAKQYFLKARDLATKLDYRFGYFDAVTYICDLLILDGEYDSLINLNNNVLKVVQKEKNQRWINITYNNLGVGYYFKSEYETSLMYFLKALKYYEKTNDVANLSIISDQLQYLYYELKDYKKAVIYGEKAVKLFSSKPTSNEYGNALLNLSCNLKNIYPPQLKKAMSGFKKVIQIARKNKNIYLEEMAISEIADIYYRLNEMEKAKYYYQRALILSKKINYVDGICSNEIGLSYYELFRYNYQKAESILHRVLALVAEKNFIKEKPQVYALLSQLELVKHNYLKYRYFLNLKDSVSNVIMNDQIIRTVKDKETLYETEKKQIQIELLQKDKKIQSIYIVGLIVIALFIILIGSIFRHNLNRKKQLVEKDAELKSQQINELEKEKKLVAIQALLVGEENERNRLARDLHDGLGGMLSVVRLNFLNMKGKSILQETDEHAFNNALLMLDESIHELRRVAHNLMPESLMRYGLKAALTDFCGSLNCIQLHFFGEDSLLIEQFKVASFRIIQELVNNAIKHAAASEINVQIIVEPDRLNIVVIDNGKGFDPSSIDYTQTTGLNSIRLRVESLNGKMDLISQPGQGTEVDIDFTINSSRND